MIKETRDKCGVCHENTPSKPSAPAQPLPQPDYPSNRSQRTDREAPGRMCCKTLFLNPYGKKTKAIEAEDGFHLLKRKKPL